MKQMLFVMNPYAGMRKANKVLTEILEIFNRADYLVHFYTTAASGDGERFVLEHAAGHDLVVCCGGDGTFNETVSGILKSGLDIPVGYIPAGSTNDFASSLRLASDPVQAARDIVAGEPERFDVGCFAGRYFSYVASFGAFTRASYATPQSVKNALGHTAYILSGIQELSQLKNEHVRLELNDGTVIEDDFLFGAISNSTSVGGILTIAPDKVDMRDGKFELLLVRAPRKLAEISECIQALQKQTYNCSMVTFLSTESIRVFASEDMSWTLDGEFESGHSEAQVNNVHHAIQILRRRKELCS